MDVFLKLKFILMVLNSNLAPLLPVPFIFDPRPVKILRKNSTRTLRHSQTKESVHINVAEVGAEEGDLFLQIIQDFPQQIVPRIHHEARGPEHTKGDNCCPDHSAVTWTSMREREVLELR